MKQAQYYDGAIDTIGASANGRPALKRSVGRAFMQVLAGLLSGRSSLILAGVADWQELRRTRQSLADLTDDQLRDVGLTREMAAREIAKSRFIV